MNHLSGAMGGGASHACLIENQIVNVAVSYSDLCVYICVCVDDTLYNTHYIS